MTEKSNRAISGVIRAMKERRRGEAVRETLMEHDGEGFSGVTSIQQNVECKRLCKERPGSLARGWHSGEAFLYPVLLVALP